MSKQAKPSALSSIPPSELTLKDISQPSFPVPATIAGKAVALRALELRRSNRPSKIDNSTLVAGSPMYYYCISCGWTADVLPESHLCSPRRLCKECDALRVMGWL